MFPPELAHRMLGGGLDLEDQPAVWPAQVEVAPVDPLVERRVRGDRQLGLGERIDLQLLQTELQASELDPLVGDDRTAHGHGRLHGEGRHLLVELAQRIGLLQRDLGEAGFIAHDHELDALLVAHRVCPPAKGHRLAHILGQLADQGPPHRSSRSSTSTDSSSSSEKSSCSIEPACTRSSAPSSSARRRSCVSRTSTRATGARIGRRASDLALRTSLNTSAVTVNARSWRPNSSAAVGAAAASASSSAASGQLAQCTEPCCHHDQTSSATNGRKGANSRWKTDSEWRRARLT